MSKDKCITEGASIGELSSLYGVSNRTFKKWITPFADYIGKLDSSRIFTPAQVKRIFEKIDEP